MSSITRTMERAIVRNKSTKEGFPEAWRKYRQQKYAVEWDEEATIIYRINKIIIKNPRKVTDEMAMEFYKKSNIPENTQKKKKHFFDDKNQYFKFFRFLDVLNDSRNKQVTIEEEKEKPDE